MAVLYRNKSFLLFISVVSLFLTACASLKKSHILHTVCLDLDDSIDIKRKEGLIKELAALGAIKSIHTFRISSLLDTKDPRLQKQCDILLTMSFVSLEKLRFYQADSEHKRIIQTMTLHLQGPPLIFDSTIIYKP